MNGISIIKQKYSSMTGAEKKIADIILADPQKAVGSTLVYIAAKADVSQGSVVNFAVKLGFSGFSQMKINIAGHIEDSTGKRDTALGGIHQIMNNRIESAYDSFKSTSDTIGAQMTRAADLLLNAEDILVTGLAHSAPVANDFAIRLMQIGLNASVQTDPLIASLKSAQMSEKAAAVVISHSGRTKEVLDIAGTAKTAGAKLVCISSYTDSPLTQMGDACLIAVSKEALHYREAVTARLTQLLICDTLIEYMIQKLGPQAVVRLDKMTEIYEKNREGLKHS